MRFVPHRICALALTLIGAVSAQATVVTLGAVLSGANEAPPNVSPATGWALVTFDDVAHTLRIQASFTGLTGNTTAAHIHAATSVPLTGTAGVATQTPTFTAFPLGVTTGSFDQTLDTSLASTFNPAFVTANGNSVAGAEAALFSALSAGRAYFNVHTNVYTGGEIRGFLVSVPDGGTSVVLLGCAWVLLAVARRRHPAVG